MKVKSTLQRYLSIFLITILVFSSFPQVNQANEASVKGREEATELVEEVEVGNEADESKKEKVDSEYAKDDEETSEESNKELPSLSETKQKENGEDEAEAVKEAKEVERSNQDDRNEATEKNEVSKEEIKEIEEEEETKQALSSEEIKSLVDASLNKTVSYYKNNLPKYSVNNKGFHSEFWVYSALWSAGVKDLKNDLNWPEDNNPWLDFTYWSEGLTEKNRTANEDAGAIIGSILLEQDPYEFGSRNLVEDLIERQKENGSFFTAWGDPWAIIALDLVDAPYDREKAIEHVLSTHRENGLFGGDWGDSDATGWALLALAPYKSTNKQVEQAINHTVEKTRIHYIESSSILGQMFGANSNSTAALLMGLAANGVDLTTEEWTNEDGNIVEKFINDYQQANGSFWWQKDNAGAFQMATEQSLLALATIKANQSTFTLMKNELDKSSDNEIDKPTVDKTKLETLINEAKDTDLTNKTNDSKEKFEAALLTATQVLENLEASQEAVEEAILTLEKAIEQLKERAPPVTVNVRVETNENTLVPPTDIEVESFDLMEYINNNNSGKSVIHSEARAIHAIVRALETIDGFDPKDDTQFGLGAGGNYIQKIGEHGEFTHGPFTGWMYFVNNEYAPVGVGDYKVQDGDSIVLYYIETYMDSTFSWFDKEYYEVEVNDELALRLHGKGMMSSSTEGAHLLIDEKVYEIDGEPVLTDKDGNVKVTFDQPGTYHISAERFNDDNERNLVRPYARVEVKETKSEPEVDNIPPLITVSGIKDGQTVKEEKVSFTAHAEDDVDGTVATTVEVNGKIIDANKNGQYSTKLEKGSNNIVVTATDTAGNVSEVKIKISYAPVVVNKNIEKAIKDLIGYMQEQGISSEWEAIGLSKAGATVPKSYEQYFAQNVESQIVGGLASGRFSITDAERLALAALAIGKDPRDINGVNLIELIYNSPDRKMWDGSIEDTMTFQGNNGLAFALIALDAAEFTVPKDARWTREKIVKELLENQREDGAWNLNDSFPSPSIDITAMVMTALAPYTNDTKVQQSIERAVEFLSAEQMDEGGYDGGAFLGGITSEATSQVIIGLTANGIDPTSEPFTKSENLIEHLLSFQLENGGFKHTASEEEANNMASEQALQALVAYDLYLKNKGSLYQFNLNDNEQEGETEIDLPNNGENQETEEDNSHLDGTNEGDNNAGGKNLDNANGNNENEDTNEFKEGSTEQTSDEQGALASVDTNGEEKADEASGDKLPQTATNHFNLLLIGLVLIFLGATLVISRRKGLN